MTPRDCLHLEFLRSAQPRGVITAIEVEAARAGPDVVAVFTHRDRHRGAGAGGLDLDGGDHAARLRAAQKFQVQAIARRNVADISTGTTQ